MSDQQPWEPDTQRFGEKYQSLPETALPVSYPLDVVRSRGLLLQVLDKLGAQKDSLVVIGAHAVIEQTQSIEDQELPESTRDSDVGVIPTLLLDLPNIEQEMRGLGLEPANPYRPGIWGLATESDLPQHQRLTIDLIAPDAVAGKGTRSADVGPHGKSVSRASGLELVLLDRQLMDVRSFGPGQRPVEAYVAGHAALMCAKVHKLNDRIIESQRNPERAYRLKPKDANDMWRLMRTSKPGDVRRVFDQALVDDRTRVASAAGMGALENITRSGNLERLLAPTFGTAVGLSARGWVEEFLNG